MAAFAVRPRRGRIGQLRSALWWYVLGQSDDQNAPAGMARRVGVVDLEGQDRMIERGLRFQAVAGSEKDVTPDEDVVDGEDGGQSADRCPNSSERLRPQELHGLFLGQQFESIFFKHGNHAGPGGHRVLGPKALKHRSPADASRQKQPKVSFDSVGPSGALVPSEIEAGRTHRSKETHREGTRYQLDADRFVTRRFPLHHFERAYDVFADAADTGALKVCLTRP